MKKTVILAMLTFCFLSLTAASPNTESTGSVKRASNISSSSEDVNYEDKQESERTDEDILESEPKSTGGTATSEAGAKQETVRVYIKEVVPDATIANGSCFINNGNAVLYVLAGVSNTRPATTWLEYKQNRKYLNVHIKERVDQVLGGTAQNITKSISAYQLTFPVDSRTQHVNVVWE